MFDLGWRRLSGFLEIDGRLWRVAFKATGVRSETYLATLHRAQKTTWRSQADALSGSIAAAIERHRAGRKPRARPQA